MKTDLKGANVWWMETFRFPDSRPKWPHFCIIEAHLRLTLHWCKKNYKKSGQINVVVTCQVLESVKNIKFVHIWCEACEYGEGWYTQEVTWTRCNQIHHRLTFNRVTGHTLVWECTKSVNDHSYWKPPFESHHICIISPCLTMLRKTPALLQVM